MYHFSLSVSLCIFRICLWCLSVLYCRWALALRGLCDFHLIQTTHLDVFCQTQVFSALLHMPLNIEIITLFFSPVFSSSKFVLVTVCSFLDKFIYQRYDDKYKQHTVDCLETATVKIQVWIPKNTRSRTEYEFDLDTIQMCDRAAAFVWHYICSDSSSVYSLGSCTTGFYWQPLD